MSEQRNPIEIHKLDFAPEYDFDKIGNIIDAMDFLRREAKNTGNQDISMVINSAFNLCFATYYIALRMQHTNKLTVVSE